VKYGGFMGSIMVKWAFKILGEFWGKTSILALITKKG